MRPSAMLLLLTLSAATALAGVRPLPKERWPVTVADAVPLIVAALTPAQRSIVVGTSRENLELLGEWGEDIEALLGLEAGNTALAAAACGAPCPVDRAVRVLMEAAWTALTADRRDGR